MREQSQGWGEGGSPLPSLLHQHPPAAPRSKACEPVYRLGNRGSGSIVTWSYFTVPSHRYRVPRAPALSWYYRNVTCSDILSGSLKPLQQELWKELEIPNSDKRSLGASKDLIRVIPEGSFTADRKNPDSLSPSSPFSLHSPSPLLFCYHYKTYHGPCNLSYSKCPKPNPYWSNLNPREKQLEKKKPTKTWSCPNTMIQSIVVLSPGFLGWRNELENNICTITIQPSQTIAIVPNTNGQESSQRTCYQGKSGDISSLLVAMGTCHLPIPGPVATLAKWSFGSLVWLLLAFRVSDQKIIVF